MGRRNTETNPLAESGRINFDSNRHASPAKALHALSQTLQDANVRVDRIEVGFEANGDVTYRYRELGAQDYEFGLLTPGEG
jgi:hypothetical protein